MDKPSQPRILACAAAVALALAGVAHAQVKTDGSLKPATNIPLVGGKYSITDTLGTYSGTNLFHSFTTFNIGTGHTGEFSGAAGTTNIIGRVTGGSASSIDGTLRSTIAGANLWLINPWGMAFGPNATLDVSGSFHASTAGYLQLGSGGRFDAMNPGSSVLTSAAPTAFGFFGVPAPITVDRSLLSVPVGKTLSLIGGKVELKGVDGLEAVLHAPAGRVNVASVAGSGQVALGATGITTTSGTPLGEIRMDKAWIVTEAPSGGALNSGPIYIRGGRLVMDDSLLYSRLGSANTSTGSGGAIDVKVTGDLLLNDSEINAGVFATGAPGDGGDVRLSAGGAMVFAGNSLVRSVSVNGAGASGNLFLSAASLTVDGSLVTTATGGAGSAGAIQVDVGDLTLANNGRIRASSIYDGAGAPPSGQAGDITVNASGSVSISGEGSGIFSSTTGYGDGGNIVVNAGNVSLSSGGSIAAESRDPLMISGLFSPMGDSGSITINARGSVVLVNATLSTFSETAGAGPITINAVDTLSLSGSAITTSTLATTLGNSAGAITIDPIFVILADGSRILTTAVVDDGGPVSISTQFFMMSPSSRIDTSSTFGRAGQVAINSPNQNTVPGLEGLPSGYFDPSALLRESCATRAGRGANSFVGVGRGGLPAGPSAQGFAAYGFAAPAVAAAPQPLLLASATLPSACVTR